MADKLHYTVSGAGQPVIIIHGLLGSSKNWQQQAKILAKNYQVFCIDLPNHGQSYRTANFDYEQTANALLKWVQKHCATKAHLIGHSMGGKVAMKALDLNANLFDKSIIVDIAPVQYPLHHLDIFEALNAVDLHHIKNRKEADVVLQRKITTASIRNFLLHSLLFKNDQWSWAFDLENLTSNQQNVANSPLLKSQINNPTLFIKGELSNYIQEKYLDEINQHFNNVGFKQIANSGHWPHAQKAKVFSLMVDKFFSC